MKKDNKGFSLVELIIVIAIMAVLIGILAPTYLRFVAKSRISTDITNAQEIATAINAAISEGAITGDTIGAVKSGQLADVNASVGLPGMQTLPTGKVDKADQWKITWTTNDGVTSIELGGEVIYPEPSGKFAP